MIYNFKKTLKLNERKSIKKELDNPTIFGITIPCVVDTPLYLGNLCIGKNIGIRLGIYNKDTEEIKYRDLDKVCGEWTIEFNNDIWNIAIK